MLIPLQEVVDNACQAKIETPTGGRFVAVRNAGRDKDERNLQKTSAEIYATYYYVFLLADNNVFFT
jgi:hypothetical protein